MTLTLSEMRKGATDVSRKNNDRQEYHHVKTTRLHDIINEITEDTHLNKTEAIEAASVMINAIKHHLSQGRHVNLGELGTLRICSPLENTLDEVPSQLLPFKPIQIIFDPSPNFRDELVQITIKQYGIETHAQITESVEQ